MLNTQPSAITIGSINDNLNLSLSNIKQKKRYLLAKKLKLPETPPFDIEKESMQQPLELQQIQNGDLNNNNSRQELLKIEENDVNINQSNNNVKDESRNLSESKQIIKEQNKSQSLSKFEDGESVNYSPRQHPSQRQQYNRGEFNQKQQPLDIPELMELQHKNIFKSKSIAQIGTPIQGPLYENGGQPIPRTIVGKPEWFVRCQGKRLTTILGGQKQSHRRKDTILSNNSHKISSHSSKDKDKQRLVNDEIHRTKGQMMQELEQIRNRIKFNIIKEREMINQLNYADRLEYTRQYRIIEKHENLEKQWIDFIIKSSNIINKDVSQSNLLAADSYRQKKEATDIFEYTKDDFEKFGTKVWYYTLRKQEQEQPSALIKKNKSEYEGQKDSNLEKLVVLYDLPDAFQKNQESNKIKQNIEIIRKPHLTDLHVQLQQKSRSQIKSNRSGPFPDSDVSKYYNQRIQDVVKNYHHLKPQEPIIHQTVEYENLAIQGQSQFEREANMIVNETPDTYFIQKQNDNNRLISPKKKNNQMEKSKLSYKLKTEEQQLQKSAELKNSQIMDEIKPIEEDICYANYDQKQKAKYGIYSSFPTTMQDRSATEIDSSSIIF